MKRAIFLWLLAVAVTLAAAYYQRRTGPTYPVRGKASLNSTRFAYRLERSHETSSGCPIRIATGDSTIAGILEWKRHGVEENYDRVLMASDGGILTAELPSQPPAGKLEYRVRLEAAGRTILLPEGSPAVIRFKGAVPLWILVPHVIAMFSAMFLSTRTGLEIFSPGPKLKTLVFWTLGTLAAGGMLLGPIVQKFAFGDYWTGWPYGADLTDNKTMLALLAWFVAAASLYKSRRPLLWTTAAAALLLAVYMIPHSVLGSEFDYSKAGQHQLDR